MSIRLRLTLLFVALWLGIGLLHGSAVVAGFHRMLWDNARDDTLAKIQQLHDYLSDLAAERLADHERLDLASGEALPRAFSDDGTYLQIADPIGRVLNKSHNLGNFDLPVPAHAGVREIDLPLPHLFESPRVLLESQRLRLPGLGKLGWVQAARPLQNAQRAVWRLVLLEGIASFASGAIALAVGFYFAGRALSPVASITTEVREWNPSDLSRRLPLPPPPLDEIGQLAKTFNDLFDRLEGVFRAQQRFVADASHELKSPLTAIRGNLQLLQRRREASPEQAASWIAAGLREVDRLTRLVGDLLTLARTEASGPDLRLERFDLTDLGREVVAALQPTHSRLTFQPSVGPVRVLGDPDRLKQVLINLVDNALRATRDAGEVKVAVGRDGETAWARVSDTGPGIPAEALQRIFDRFYRVDQGRGRSDGGSGLGLAIAQAIAQAHQGVLEATSELGKGASFTLKLPLARRDSAPFSEAPG